MAASNHHMPRYYHFPALLLEALNTATGPAGSIVLKSFPVSSRVNRPLVDEALLVEPIDISQEITTGMLF
jgi:hypothetical protein